MSDRLVKLLTSLRLTVVLLSAGLALVFVGTLAQVHEGLYQAQARYFKSFFVWKPTIGDTTWPILLPGGYLIGSLLLLNLLAAHATRFKFTKKKIGIAMIHLGIILLLVGQMLTDVLARESYMLLSSEGPAKDYSESSLHCASNNILPIHCRNCWRRWRARRAMIFRAPASSSCSPRNR